jgi:hypothetical protein
MMMDHFCVLREGRQLVASCTTEPTLEELLCSIGFVESPEDAEVFLDGLCPCGLKARLFELLNDSPLSFLLHISHRAALKPSLDRSASDGVNRIPVQLE